MTALALHTGAAAALLAYEPARTQLAAAAPIMVEWIAAPVAPPKPPPVKRHVSKPKPEPVISRAPQPEPPAVVAPPAPPLAAAPAPMVAAAPPAPPAAAPAPVEITPPVFNADYLQNPAPAYPAHSRRLHEQGRVVLRVLVSAAGSAEEVEISASSGHGRLDEAARETVRHWKFHPARRGAEAVPAWVLVPIRFSLDT